MLGWGPLVSGGIGPDWARSVAGVIIGTFPAFAAWMGLWWSQYPADRALREQSLLIGTKVPEKRDLLTSNRRGIHCRSIQPRDLGGEGGFSPKPRPLKTKKPGCSSQFPQVCSSPPLQLGRVTWRNKVRISHALRAPASDARARIVSAMLATVRA